jgi:hypothetical protein
MSCSLFFDYGANTIICGEESEVDSGSCGRFAAAHIDELKGGDSGL